LKRRAIACVFIAACLLCSCMTQKGCMASKTPEPPFVDQIPAAKFVEAAGRDSIDVHIYVYTGDYLYLFSETPIEVYAPGDSAFIFDESIYKLNPVSLIFPLVVRIKVPESMNPGENHRILLPMRLFYKHKSNETMRTRTAVVKIPVRIVENKTDRRRTHRFMVEYELE